MIRPRLVFGLIMAGASLSACGGKSDSDDTVATNDSWAWTASAEAKPEDRFGEEFGKAFRADPNSEPAKVADGDVPPVSLTTEPLQID